MFDGLNGTNYGTKAFIRVNESTTVCALTLTYTLNSNPYYNIFCWSSCHWIFINMFSVAFKYFIYYLSVFIYGVSLLLCVYNFFFFRSTNIRLYDVNHFNYFFPVFLHATIMKPWRMTHTWRIHKNSWALLHTCKNTVNAPNQTKKLMVNGDIFCTNDRKCNRPSALSIRYLIYISQMK